MPNWTVVVSVHGRGTFDHRPLRFDNAVVAAMHEFLPFDLVEVEPDATGQEWHHEFGGHRVSWRGSQLFALVHTSGAFWTVDWVDSPSNVAVFAAAPGWRGTWVCLAHNQERLDRHMPRALQSRVHVGWTIGFTPETVRLLPRVPVDPNRFLWAGCFDAPGRKPAGFLSSDVAEVHAHRLDRTIAWPRESWTTYAARFGACLALPGGAPFNNREADCWGAGIPTLVLSHDTRLRGDPEPGKCWIDVPASCFEGNPVDPEATAEAIRDTWLRVRTDEPYLRSVRDEARKYYEAYCTPRQIARQIVQAIAEDI